VSLCHVTTPRCPRSDIPHGRCLFVCQVKVVRCTKAALDFSVSDVERPATRPIDSGFKTVRSQQSNHRFNVINETPARSRIATRLLSMRPLHRTCERKALETEVQIYSSRMYGPHTLRPQLALAASSAAACAYGLVERIWPFAGATDKTDRRTDRQTDFRPLHACTLSV